ncbi:MAG: fibrobacter succinogenes major paralogous domain-containing protein [Crocinitomicaceae bacterium]|nr:fibrobacter succinogenes major paralogous domain-containing protein [Flavobacteriales bacterium]NQZ38456.1 fibrobacter succinogenes major paralogous domain-containing protein [Crocinitomicaceae bacterium]
MIRNLFPFLCFTIVVVIIGACSTPVESEDNNKPIPNEVQIGNQVWSTHNLDADKFRNGDRIKYAKTEDDWTTAMAFEKPAWCYYKTDSKNGKKFGKLYNWYAVNDPRGLAPKGWHIPSNNEWQRLLENLGGKKDAGNKIKTKNHWKETTGATNESSFYAMPAGYRNEYATFEEIGDYYSGWWTSSQFDDRQAKYRYVDATMSSVEENREKKGFGFSVRCIKD